ncbi:MAG: FKBP-type peptidyl-prolyl cis-trans isomerase [Gemmatimonadetes bacterium]|nr:FKBP-type peptidyl-prolyl cis-trans isomerase [Gemmatimonadota bacterium]
MKTFRVGVIVALVAACGKQTGGGNVNLASAEDSVSYIIGFQIGGTLQQQGAPARPEAFAQGVQDAMNKKPGRFAPEQMRNIVMAFQQKRLDSATGEGDKFLADNAKNEGVKTTPSGLQWKALREGKGTHPKATSTVTVHYKGTLPNGTAFDSSYGGQPVSFPLNRVISGWTEGVQLMTPGSKYQFWLPSNLAYGEQGSPPAIGPNQPLVFEIELISFK